MAASVVAILPVLVLFVLFQRYLQPGVCGFGSADELARDLGSQRRISTISRG
jgi:hypothetical protein